MREIKFRAWDKINKKWVLPEKCHYTSFSTDNPYFIWGFDPQGCGCENEWDIDIQQFVGLKDKNGKEIYEGDWCRANFRDKDGFHYRQGPIMMDGFMWCLNTGNEMYPINHLYDWEIIGNIYEDPGLLK